jgi:hypothetical protein
VDGGLPVVLSQTFRTLIHSRLELGMKGYENSHPHTDILLFEPDHRDPEMFLANTFGYSQRRSLAEHAYQQHPGRPALAAQRGGDDCSQRMACGSTTRCSTAIGGWSADVRSPARKPPA